MELARTILVLEDGAEYAEAFTRLVEQRPDASVEFLRAGDFEEARRILEGRPIDALFLDVVFDRTPPDRLAGHLQPLITRFGGDRRRAERYLAENQGFYLLDALAPLIPVGIRIVLAYDFSDEPGRLAALRERLSGLCGLPDGTPISQVIEALLGVA